MTESQKKLVVTGAGRGIGRAIAEHFVRKGWKVFAVSRTQSELDAGARTLEGALGEWVSVVADTATEAGVREVFTHVRSEPASLDAMILAAGIYGPIGPFLNVDFKEWEKTIQVNLVGSARMIHALGSKLKRPGGRVVLFSGGGQAAFPNFSAYATSKGGIWRLTETLGAELAREGIFCNAIAPGAVNTRLLEELLAAGPERAGKETYERSLKQKDSGGESPALTVKLCEYLLSDRSEGLYGKTLSAKWDDFEQLQDLEKISRSDLYGFRRVVRDDGGTRV